MIRKLLRLARTLSLDIVLGAVVSSLFIADYMQVEPSWSMLLALAICVWLIYTTDHLSDAYHIPHNAHTYRHQFHQKNFKALSGIIVFISILGLILLTQIPFTLILWGSIVLSLVGIYFISIRWLKLQAVFHKEFVIALLYCVGVFLAPVYLSSSLPGPRAWILFAQYILLALSNLLLFSWYEKELDQLDFHVSYATIMGKHLTTKTINICIWILYGITGISIILYFTNISFLFTQFIILCMLATLHSIFLFPSYFQKYEMYRSLADAIFLYPLLYLVM